MEDPTPLQFIVQAEDEGRKIRHILQSRLGLSTSLIKRLRENNKVRLNGFPVYLTRTARIGDILTIDLFFKEEVTILPQPMDLDIIFEDDDFLVVNKPPGMLVHPVGKEITDTLANGVSHYWLKTGLSTKFRPIHRLDRNTSGLVVIGKNQFAHQGIFNQFEGNLVLREYLALVEGAPGEKHGTINAPIARKPGSLVERWVNPSGQKAVTHYSVLRIFSSASLLALTLETGRTHQIRVHLSHLGHPILGDTLYGGSDNLINRQALHSSVFGFIHPRTGKQVKFSAPLAPDMQTVMQKIPLEKPPG